MDLLRGAAFLLALSLIQSFVIRLWPIGHRLSQVVSGLVFGGVSIAGMMTPIELQPGVLVDARPVIISMAAATGGPLVGIIAALMAGAFRLWLGGIGMYMGTWTVALSLGLGLGLYYARRRGLVTYGPLQFLLFGFIANALSLLCLFLVMPVIKPHDFIIYGVYHVGIYAAATALLGTMLQDIWKRYETERALQESEARYRTAYDSMPVGIIETDDGGTILSMNRAAEDLYRCRAEDAVGRSMGMFLPDEVKAPFNGDIGAFIANVVEPSLEQSVEVEGRRADGSHFPIQVNNGVMRVAGGRRYITLVTDLSNLRSLEKKLLRFQKMEAVGQLTGGIAHDFNNILGIVLGNLEILEDLTKDDPVSAKRVSAALAGVRRGSEITRKLLNFSRQVPSEARLIDVNDVLRGMYPLVSRSLTASIELEAHLADGLWPVVADPGDLQDAMLNLALNARDAMPDGGKLIVETANMVLEGGLSSQGTDLPGGDYVCIEMSDTGSGMSEEVRAAAFEPFFSTKEEGRGSGLGLSMVYGFVRRSRGRIDIYSEMGKGTTVCICLPRASEGEAHDSQPSARAVTLPRGSETVLVVDDESGLTDIAAVNLGALGYTVLQAGDAREALKLLEEGRSVDLLFTDVILPGAIDGYKLAADVRRRWPEVKILVTSGFSKRREEAVHSGRAETLALARRLLRKPYTRAELAAAVRHALDRDGPQTGGEALSEVDA